MQTEQLVPCHEGTVASARELQRMLEQAGIESELATGKTCASHGSGGGCGCGPKVQVLVREEDFSKVQTAFRGQWLEALKKEGVVPEDTQMAPVPEEGELPCPACGTAAPLVEGACSDCGLQLE